MGCYVGEAYKDSGYVFLATDFFGIADTDPVNKALSRLNKRGEIRRIIKGVYARQ